MKNPSRISAAALGCHMYVPPFLFFHIISEIEKKGSHLSSYILGNLFYTQQDTEIQTTQTLT